MAVKSCIHVHVLVFQSNLNIDNMFYKCFSSVAILKFVPYNLWLFILFIILHVQPLVKNQMTVQHIFAVLFFVRLDSMSRKMSHHIFKSFKLIPFIVCCQLGGVLVLVHDLLKSLNILIWQFQTDGQLNTY